MKDFLKISISLTIVLGGFFLFVSPSFAQGVYDIYTIDGVDVEIDTEFFDNWGVTVEVANLDPTFVATSGTVVTPGGSFNFVDDFPGDGYLSFGSGLLGYRDFNSSDFGNWSIIIEGNYQIILEFSYNENFEVVPVGGVSNATWGDSGIWGEDFSVADVPTVLEASVQATGFQLWPLLIFSGIAIAFIIFLQVVFLVDNSVKPKTRKKFDNEKFNKKADELQEFFSKTGGASPEAIESIRRGKK